MLINKRAARRFVIGNSEHITRIDKNFFALLEVKVKALLKSAVTNNLSRKTLANIELSDASLKERGINADN